MCSIFELKAGTSIPDNMLNHAVWNNPHGYGIVLKDKNDRLDVKKKFTESGTDPDEVRKILNENIDLDRYVHLRWRSAGEIGETNTQPFSAYHSNSRQVYFMHNGTFIAGEQSLLKETYDDEDDLKLLENKEASDTLKFCRLKLQPTLQRVSGFKGKADLSDPFVIEVIKKVWPAGNRGLLISNDLPPLFLGHWQSVKAGGTEFWASNNDYFHTLKRGFKFDEQEAQREKERAERLANASSFRSAVPNSAAVSPLTSRAFSSRFEIGEKLKDLMEDYNIHEASGWLALANLSVPEIETFVEKAGNDVVYMILHLTRNLREVTEKNVSLETKLERASLHCEAVATASTEGDSEG